ncbi:hypothetical protein [Mucilaginibacter frigoritolerans]|uniref:hypothetical protein n=1 Tax=Mucilaginibacter frigoritolerans TaxID=652788 RepID=UPI0011A05294|nr:hypothetical protein [Mucilaginibacter frigoritolerans]
MSKACLSKKILRYAQDNKLKIISPPIKQKWPVPSNSLPAGKMNVWKRPNGIDLKQVSRKNPEASVSTQGTT